MSPNASSAAAPVEQNIGMIPSKLLPIRMTSTVVKGYGRGSAELGIPTANLERDNTTAAYGMAVDDMPCGIYWGFARVGMEDVYKTAVSIGYNPTYKNTTKTVEPHLIAPQQDTRRHASLCGETVLRDFYGEPIRLSVVGYLRPELPFEGIEKLVEAIKKDIVDTEMFADGSDASIMAEKAWVESDDPVETSSMYL